MFLFSFFFSSRRRHTRFKCDWSSDVCSSDLRFERLQNAYPVKRSALIPMLMYAQDEFGFISDQMIAEIAGRLELRTVQVEETLAYYSMLHRKPMGKHHVQVCTNIACMLRRGYDILEQAKKRLEIGHKEVTKDGVFSLEEVECIGACTGAPAIQVNYDFYENLTPSSFDAKDRPKPNYVICNAVESEAGTCKDLPLMEMVPHQLIEGMVIAGRAIGANRGFIYIRGEYRYVLDLREEGIQEASQRGYLGKNILGSGFDYDLLIHTGAGAYECGEESALMESLEGKRGYPRIKPPFPAVVGLYGCPTIINNVETLSAIPAIINEGGEAYANRGTPKNGGTRLLLR